MLEVPEQEPAPVGMSLFRRLGGVKIVVAAVVILAVAVVAAAIIHTILRPPPKPPPMPIQTEADLDSLLLSTEEINNIMGVSHMQINKDGHVLDYTRDSVSDPNCFGSIYSGEQSVYADSGWFAVSDRQMLEQPGDFYVSQTAVAFRSADQALAFLGTSADKWKACAGRTVTTDKHTWTVGELTGASPNIAQLNTADGWGCQHALRAVSNAVIDVKACSGEISNEASRIADTMVAKVPKKPK